MARYFFDFVNDSARSLQKGLGAKDRDRLDQYFSSVRDLESQLAKTAEWETKPKPKVVGRPVGMGGRVAGVAGCLSAPGAAPTGTVGPAARPRLSSSPHKRAVWILSRK